MREVVQEQIEKILKTIGSLTTEQINADIISAFTSLLKEVNKMGDFDSLSKEVENLKKQIGVLHNNCVGITRRK